MAQPIKISETIKPRYHARQLLSADLMNEEVAWLDVVRFTHKESTHGGGEHIPANAIEAFEGGGEITLTGGKKNDGIRPGVTIKNARNMIANINSNGVALNGGLAANGNQFNTGQGLEIAGYLEDEESTSLGSQTWSINRNITTSADELRLISGVFDAKSAGVPSRLVVGRTTDGRFNPLLTVHADGEVEFAGALSVEGQILTEADKESAREALPLSPDTDKTQPEPPAGKLVIALQPITGSVIAAEVSVTGLQSDLTDPKYFLTLVSPGKMQEGPVFFEMKKAGPIGSVVSTVKSGIGRIINLLNKIPFLAGFIKRIKAFRLPRFGGGMAEKTSPSKKTASGPKAIKDKQKVQMFMALDQQRWQGVASAILVVVLRAKSSEGKTVELSTSSEVSLVNAKFGEAK